jgi:hypothetical protein
MLNLFCRVLFVVISSLSLCQAAERLTISEPVVIEATGEASGSDLDSPREICSRAKTEAQRSAIEQAVGTFIRSHTIVSNGQIAEDLIHAQVNGRIGRLETMHEERALSRCRVRIRALVYPEFPDAREAIQVKAALSRSLLRAGEDVELQYQVNRNGYVYLFVVAEDGSVTQLLPNSEIRDNRVQAGTSYVFPQRASRIHLKAFLQKDTATTGADERIKIIVTHKPEPLLERGFQEGFAVFDAGSTALVSDLLKRLSQLPLTDWGEATLEYRITP